MKLAVSNIAWTNDEEKDIALLLQKLDIHYVEIAPTKIWSDPTIATDKEIKDYVDFWKAHDIEIVAFQSMLFNKPELRFFQNEADLSVASTFLKDFTKLAGRMGAKRMVFGSPKNRQRGDVSLEQAQQIAHDFFKEIGSEAQKNNVVFCIEPNAPQYNCDFVTNAQEGIAIVNAVDNAGFGLHLDIACMALAGDDVAASIEAAKDVLQHFHISAPRLEAVEESAGMPYAEAAAALQAINYEGFVSIEMKPGEAGQNGLRVKQAVKLAKKYYQV